MKFFEQLKKFQQFLTRPISFILAIMIALYPFLPWPNVKYIILGVLGGLILRIIFEIEADLKKSNTEIIGRVNSIQSKIHEADLKNTNDEILERIISVQEIINTPYPPSWKNFTEVQQAILSSIRYLLEKEEDIHIDILGVSARYSWRMIEDQMSPIISHYANRNFLIEIAVSDETLLKKWQLYSWEKDLERTINGINEFKNIHKEQVMNGRLKINKYKYDSLPQWHGVMINKKILYLGRTKWTLNAYGTSKFEVGTCEYRLFEPNDIYGGYNRIIMFDNWVDRFIRRSSELESV